MSLKIGKRDIKRMAELLDQEHESAEAAGEAALALAWEIYEEKAKYTVVGQLRYSQGYVDQEDADTSKIALGRYGTEKQALDAARALVFSTPTGESFRAWVLAVHHGTPNEYFQLRNKARKARAIEEGGKTADWDERARFFEQYPGVMVASDTTTRGEE